MRTLNITILWTSDLFFKVKESQTFINCLLSLKLFKNSTAFVHIGNIWKGYWYMGIIYVIILTAPKKPHIYIYMYTFLQIL